MTDKQERFIVEYPVDFNRTKAAIRAGYSEKTAYSIGCELLKKPEIQAAIQEHVDELIGDTNKIVLDNVRFWEDMRDDVEASENARLKASELLGKYLAMFTEKIELGGSVNIDTEFKIVKGPDGNT